MLIRTENKSEDKREKNTHPRLKKQKSQILSKDTSTLTLLIGVAILEKAMRIGQCDWVNSAQSWHQGNVCYKKCL